MCLTGISDSSLDGTTYSYAEAERLLADEKQRKLHEKLSSSPVVDQLVVAADIKPRRFRTKWQKSCYEGPTARQDAESAERSRWINLLANLLRHTDTPMERLLRENPANSHALHEVTWKELLASAIPGKAPRQPPRCPTFILAALEDVVMSAEAPTYWRAMSWWILVQCWATLRFDDHRGIVPAELEVTESGLLDKRKRSKVTGPDKKLNFRLLVIHSSACVHQKLWMLTGWQLLEKDAFDSRDYLPPAPSNNYRRVKNKELKYQVAFAVQTRLLAFATYRGQGSFGRAQDTITRPIAGGTLCQQPQQF